MTTLTTEAGMFARVEGTRRIRGLLLPYGERSRLSVSGAEPVAFERGTVALPRDPSVVTLNRQHDRFDPIGRAATLEDTELGVVAEFEIADTPEGDAYLADPGALRKLSAEVAGIVRSAVDRTRAAAGRITGAALVDEGAFASAALFAVGDIADEPAATEHTPLAPDENGDISIAATETPSTVTVTAGDSTTVFQPGDAEPASAPESKEDATMAAATVPNTAASKGSAASDKIDADGLFALIHRAITTHDKGAFQALAEEHGDALFALTDVKISGSSQVGTGVIQPQWLGELWSGKQYAQKYIPCFGQPQNLTSPTLAGWRWTTPPTVASWTGNKTAIPSGALATGTQAGFLQRFAAGHDLAREFYDFPAGAEIVASYIRKLVESYAKVSDLWFRDQIIGLAGSPVAYDSFGVPAGVSPAWAKVVQGALAIVATEDDDSNGNTPSFAWVAPDVFKSILLTRSDDSSAFLSAAMGFEQGQITSFPIIPTAALPEGEVLVGAREAVTPYQLPGSPIRVNALDIANGGQDEAVFGYAAGIVNDLTGLVLVGNEFPDSP